MILSIDKGKGFGRGFAPGVFEDDFSGQNITFDQREA
jgi:hypothetical protein